MLCCGNVRCALAVVDKRQLIPVRPIARGHAGLDAAVVETALLHGIAAADVHAHMPVRAQRDAGQFRQAGSDCGSCKQDSEERESELYG